jgi:hypothetical protein
VNIVPIVFPTWYKLQKTTSQYVGKEEQFVQDAIAKSGLDVSGFDIVEVINSQTVGKLNAVTYSSLPIWGNSPPNRITISEYNQVGTHAHEIGHALGEILVEGGDKTLISDLYKMGMYGGDAIEMTSYGEGRWDLMATGDRNGGLFSFGKDPSLMSSYTKEFLKLLAYNIKPKSFHGNFIIPALNQKPLGGSVFRYNLLENTDENDDTTPYYILETRKKDLPDKKWDTSILKDALVAYYVNPLGFPEYGQFVNASGTIYRSNECRTINIPKGGVMRIGDTYNDYDNLVAFSALSETNLNGKYLINASIQHIGKESFSYKFNAAFLRPTSEFNVSRCTGETGNVASGSPADSILYVFVLAIRLGIILLALSVLFFALYYKYRKQWVLNPSVRKSLIILFTLIGILSVALISLIFYALSENGYDLRDAGKHVFDPNYYDPLDIGEPHDASFAYSSPFTPATLPDLDLHAVTPDGKHVGVNYATGEYENQIAGAIPSGDNQGSPEWILIPEGTEARYYVSSHDNQTFLNENPDIASKMGSTNDSYEVYARYFDPATGIFTSATTSQTILPGATDFYQITGTTTPSVIQTDKNAKDLISLSRSFVSSLSMPKTLRQILLSETNIVEKLLAKNLKKPALAMVQSEKRIIELFTCGTKKTDLFAGMQTEKNAVNVLAKEGINATDITGMNGLFNQFGRSQKCGLAKSDADILLGILNKLEGIIRK